MRAFTVLGFAVLSASLACAAPHKVIIAKPGKQDAFVSSGVFRGGDAGRNFIFHDLRRGFAKETERYILEFTGGNGELLRHRPGFYQVHVDPKLGRITMEFSQVLGSRINGVQLQKAMSVSPYLKLAKMTYDPEDSGLTLQLFLKDELKHSFEVEVFELVSADKGGRMAIDIRRRDLK